MRVLLEKDNVVKQVSSKSEALKLMSRGFIVVEDENEDDSSVDESDSELEGDGNILADDADKGSDIDDDDDSSADESGSVINTLDDKDNGNIPTDNADKDSDIDDENDISTDVSDNANKTVDDKDGGESDRKLEDDGNIPVDDADKTVTNKDTSPKEKRTKKS